MPAEQIILVDREGKSIRIEELVERIRVEQDRILVDDEVGLVIYVGGLGIYNLKPTDSGEFLAQPVTEISQPRFSPRVLRKQIGATILSITADAVFIIHDGSALKKVRAENLEPGMVLVTGEKVYI